ncbi:hypothetical protein ACFLZL_02845 [Thermodesulfobacteriota bacterium]
MNVPLAEVFEGKKFMWDGEIYGDKDQAKQAAEAYRKDGFEAQQVEKTGQHLVYSRRIAQVQAAE